MYAAALLVLVCPDRTLAADAEEALRARVLHELDVNTLLGLKACSVLIARLDDAEAQLGRHLETLLPNVVLRPEKAMCPLSCASCLFIPQD